MFAPKSVGRMAIKAYFAFIQHSETSRGARRWRLDTIRNAKGARLVVKSAGRISGKGVLCFYQNR